MRERRQKHVDRHKETKADKVSENEEDDKHCKDRARPLASSGLKLPLTALKRQGINTDSNRALSLYPMKIWPGIPLSPAIET